MTKPRPVKSFPKTKKLCENQKDIWYENSCISRIHYDCLMQEDKIWSKSLACLAKTYFDPDFSTWKNLKTLRTNHLNRYLKKNQENFDWFLHWYFGKGNGLPIAFYIGFPQRWPKIWPKDWIEEVGLAKHPKQFSQLPVFLELSHKRSKGDDLPLGFIRAGDKLGIDRMGQTCASCHVGRVVNERGEIEFLIGAPNTTWDPFLFKKKIKDTVNQKNFNAKTLTFTHSELNKMNLSPGQRAKYNIFWTTGLLSLVLKETKKVMNNPDYLDERVYKRKETGDQRMQGGMPGHVEITSPIIGSQMKALLSMDDKTREETLNKILSPGPVVVDYMSVWQQARQTAGQWDGDTPDHLLRNLGAEVAGVADPKMVEYENALKTTAFLSQLPSPPYIFQVDWKKAKIGKQIYRKACYSCHQGNQYISLSLIKTDPNRAKGLRETTRKILAQMLLDSCHDKSNPSCNLEIDEVILDLRDNPGYVAPFLDGLWARAPYLHNGSVPSLYHILVPEERPKKFLRGHLEYDQKNVGFVWDKKEGMRKKWVKEYDTSLPGYSNKGHGSDPKDRKVFFGDYDFAKDHDAREALLEYLKTF